MLRVTQIALTWFIFFLCLCRTASAQNLFKLEGSFVQSTSQKVELFLIKAEQLLPPKMIQQLPKTIKIKFSDLSVLGHTTGSNKIILNSKFLSEIENGAEQSSVSSHMQIKHFNLTLQRQHKTLYQEALATILHETFHIYDSMNIQESSTKQYQQKCKTLNSLDSRLRSSYEICDSFLNIKTTLSTHPYYLDKSGWYRFANHGSHQDVSVNNFRFRSPDTYELKNPEEHAAVNFEYFILDPQYKCRRPTLYRYFQAHFHWNPSSEICNTNYYYADPSSYKITESLKNIDLSRVYEIHYLMADSGQDLMSRWGHSMIRLVICAPGKDLGPSCIHDVKHHLVLSFRAYVNATQLSNLKGLTGGYSSRLFITPLTSVMDEYNKVELRDLLSLPIRMSRDQIQELIEKAMETHWSYSGQYYFISNNCAVETFNLIRASLHVPALYQYRVQKPMDLWNALVKSNLSESAIFDNPQMAFEKRYLFTSYSKRYTNLLNSLGIDLQFDTFLKQSFDDRKKAYDQLKTETHMQVLQKWSAVSLLEEGASLRYWRTYSVKYIEASMKEKLKSEDTINQIKSVKELEEQILKSFGVLSAPYELLSIDHYGLPDDYELSVVQEKIKIVQQKRSQDMIALEKKQNFDVSDIQEIKKSLDLQKESTLHISNALEKYGLGDSKLNQVLKGKTSL